MAQFRYMGFTFDGQAGVDLGYYLINPTGDNNGIVGTKRSVKEEDTGKTTRQFNGVSYDSLEFDIHICKMNEDHSKILEIDEDDMFFLNNWFMKPKTYKVFSNYPLEWEYGYNGGTCVARDIYYYCIFTSMQDVKVDDMRGYVVLHMRLNSGFAYSPILHNNLTVVNEDSLTINTRSNIDETILPDVMISNATGTITISNEETGTTMVLNNLKSDHVYYCYNEDMKRIIEYSTYTDTSQVATTTNMANNFNKVWLTLDGYGENNITVTGSCDIDIIYQNKLAIQR